MKKLVILITINLLLPFIILILLPSIFIKVRQGISLDHGDNLISLTSANPITFNFISDKNYLDSISLRLKNPSIVNNSKITVDISSKNSQRSLVFFGSNVGDPSSVPLKFPTLNEPAGTKYTVDITTDNSIHDGLYILTDNQNQPLFQTFYKSSNIKDNLVYNVSSQSNNFKNRSLVHNIGYILSLLSLNLLLIIKRDS